MGDFKMLETKDKKKTGGLAGVVAGDSAICLCGVEEQSLRYRGYSIEDLTEHSTFEEVAWLLLRGELPSAEELKAYKNKLKGLRDLPKPLKSILEKIPPTTNMMDVMRTGCSVLGNFEPETDKTEKFAIADRLIACFSSILLYWHHFHKTGKAPDLNTKGDSIAGHILELTLEKKPT